MKDIIKKKIKDVYTSYDNVINSIIELKKNIKENIIDEETQKAFYNLDNLKLRQDTKLKIIHYIGMKRTDIFTTT